MKSWLSGSMWTVNQLSTMPVSRIDGVAKLRNLVVRACRLIHIASLVLLFLGIPADSTYAYDAETSTYSATLREHGIEPNAAGMGKYLRLLHPNVEQQREARRLVEQLGSKTFANRESAMKRLISLPSRPIEALRVAAEGHDLEVRWRARKILAMEKPQGIVLLHAIFKTVEQNKVTGLTAELLRAAALCERRHLRLAVQSAVRATARPDDASVLWSATKDKNREVVITAIYGLGAALRERADDDLQRLLNHKTEEISLAAARSLANQGNRASLATLLKLLDAASLEVRIGAVQTLRQVSDTQHKYLAYEDASARSAAVARWTAWVNGKGLTAKLHFPLKTRRIEFRRTLITFYAQNKVIELDASGKQIWVKTGLAHPLGSSGLPNGHRLVSCLNGGSVIEYDASGKEVWRHDKLPKRPFMARRLENGNTLIACYDSNKVVEVRPDGSTAWEVTVNGKPTDMRRLESGRTLVAVCGSGRVVEVDRMGKVQWEINGLNKPIAVQRLENGNTLVAELLSGQVTERDRNGKIVWQHIGLDHPRSAERLSNGHTLIAHKKDVREVDRQGKIIWKKQITAAAHATRY